MSQKGLANVTAGETALCKLGGESEELYYRGYNACKLADNYTFEAIAFLLFKGHLPSEQEIDTYTNELRQLTSMPVEVEKTLRELPEDANAMDVLRTGVSLLGIYEPETDNYQGLDIANRLLVLLPRFLAIWRGISIPDNATIAEAVCLACCDETVDEAFVDAMNQSLILYAEHEFNASTFAARVTSATLSDMYSAICSAIGTLRGPLHGGANEQALYLIKSFENVESVESGIKQKLSDKEKLMGFGHRVYKTKDPRSHKLYNILDSLPNTELFDIAKEIERVMMDEKHLISNVDFYTAVLYEQMKIKPNLFVAIFVFGRIVGWAAHVLEQRNNNRLIRPLADYVGPDPID
ncbi:MAG: citrate/2-methylcitrate synthase [Pseudomonadota bacterium]|nr:citrate/2-methylcitrate synthase [Pseudomonadota bacterium]